MNIKKPLILNLAADEQRAMRGLSFTAKCKNTGKVHTYNFGGRPQYEHLRAITEIFVWALYKRRHHNGHVARCSIRDCYWKFLKFLDEIKVREPSQLSGKTLSAYVQWLKTEKSGLTYSTAAAQYRAMSQVFIQMSQHESVSSNFRPVKNAFPKSTSLQTPDVGYDQAELKSIVRAAVRGMRETMSKYSTAYVPNWLDKPAPLDDVAPRSANGGSTLWASMEYRIWWWENKCHCQILNSKQLSKIPQGQVFLSNATSGKAGMVGVREFYSTIGAGESYIPKYLGKECPIKYRTPWKKLDYLVWYWENKIGCAVLSLGEVREVAPEFYVALKEYFDGKISWFYEYLGIYRWIGAQDLIPFYLMLLVRTQLNPSTVQRLLVDCLVDDPINQGRKLFSYVKYRSFKGGNTIPSKETEEGWPVALLNKVLKITESFRLPGQEELWISNSNRHKETLPLGESGFKRALKTFSQKHNLRHTSGGPLIIQAKLIRPTMAWQEYLRTEDMTYLQSILGHETLGRTAEYLRRISDPVLKMRRAVHLEAVFLGLTGANDDEAVGGQVIATDGFLNHCRGPLNSPIAGQREGYFCTASHEVCLGCPNLVITLEDIKKYFCYMRYHDQLMEACMITEDEYQRATAEKKFIWETQILPRYSPGIIQSVRADADLNPIGIWSPTAEGVWL